MSISALMIVLLWQISATSIVADFLSDHDCIRCLCVVETNSPDCIREQCDRDSTSTDKNNLNFFNNFGNYNNNNNHHNTNNYYHPNENNHFISTHEQNNGNAAINDENQKNNDRSEHHIHIGRTLLKRKKRTRSYVNSTHSDIFIGLDVAQREQNNGNAAMSEENQTHNNTSEHNAPIRHYFSKRKNRTRPYVNSTQNDILIDMDNLYPAPVNQEIPKTSKGSCGPFNLDIHYYIKCGRPDIRPGDGDTVAFARCATNTKCATKCVQTYVKMFNNNCPGQTSCEIWSRIHFGHNMGLRDGSGCQISSTLAKWSEMKECLEKQRVNIDEYEYAMHIRRNLTIIPADTLNETSENSTLHSKHKWNRVTTDISKSAG